MTPHDIMRDFSDAFSNSTVDKFEEWLYTEMAELVMDHRIPGPVVQGMLAIAWKCYRQGLQDGNQAALEAYSLAGLMTNGNGGQA